VRVNNLKYLVSDAGLWNKKVEVRFECSDQSKVYVWSSGRYYGEAFVFAEENDFIKRQEIMQRIITVPEVNIPDTKDVPLYSRLERQLSRHREEIDGMGLNEQILLCKQKKETVRANLLKKSSGNEIDKPTAAVDFSADAFIYLLMKLLKRKFTPSERLSAHTLWSSVGPIDEKLVRTTAGRLLGEEYPSHDLNGYLEEIRTAVITNSKNIK
jgi:hypothetical protein